MLKTPSFVLSVVERLSLSAPTVARFYQLGRDSVTDAAMTCGNPHTPAPIDLDQPQSYAKKRDVDFG